MKISRALSVLAILPLIACQPEPRQAQEVFPEDIPEPHAQQVTPALSPEEATAALPGVASNPNSNPEEIKSLLDAGANPRQVNTDATGEDIPVLYYVASQGSEEALRLLLEAGASWDQLSQAQLDQALLMAACDRSPYAVEELLSAGADPNYENHLGETPLGLLKSEVCPVEGYTKKRALLIGAGAVD